MLLNPMKLIVGLGNPGKAYENTRHNVGAFVVQEFLETNAPPFTRLKLNKKFKALVAKGEVNDEELILAFPKTFMNEAGQAVKALVHYYRLESKDILVIHDDLDLPLGKIRLKKNGGSAGHKGIQSIINQLGSNDFTRLRLGIATGQKHKIPTEKFVLQKFSSAEQAIIAATAKKTIAVMEFTLKNGVEKAMNKYN